MVIIAIKGMGHVLVEHLKHMDFCTVVFKLSLSFIFIFMLQSLNMNYRPIKANFPIPQPPVPSQHLLMYLASPFTACCASQYLCGTGPAGTEACSE